MFVLIVSLKTITDLMSSPYLLVTMIYQTMIVLPDMLLLKWTDDQMTSKQLNPLKSWQINWHQGIIRSGALLDLGG